MTPLPLARLALLALASSLLAACASTGGLAPRETPRNADTLQAGQTLAGASTSPVAWPHAHWWKRLGDAQLDALIEEALRDSPSLAAADARTRKAVAQAGLADAARQPQVGAKAQATALQIPETLAPPPIGGDLKVAEILSLSVAYAPDLWGGKRAKWEAALGAARAQEADAQAARTLLASNIARTYVALAQAFDAREAALAEAARSDALARLQRQRVDAGIDNRIGLEQATSLAAGARQQAQAAQQQIDGLRNALATLAGAGPDRGLALQRPTLLQRPAVALPTLLPSELVARRADVAAARWRVEAASRGIAASRAEFYPSINLAAMVGLAAGSLSDLFGSDALLINGGPAVSLPIFDGGRLRNQLAASDADYDLAVANYHQTLLTALREVVDAVQAARALDAQIAQQQVAHDAARKAWELMSLRRKAGLANALDVLNAQQPLLRLQQQLDALRARRVQAAIDLDAALGGGVPVAAAPMPAAQAQAATPSTAFPATEFPATEFPATASP